MQKGYHQNYKNTPGFIYIYSRERRRISRCIGGAMASELIRLRVLAHSVTTHFISLVLSPFTFFLKEIAYTYVDMLS